MNSTKSKLKSLVSRTAIMATAALVCFQMINADADDQGSESCEPWGAQTGNGSDVPETTSRYVRDARVV